MQRLHPDNLGAARADVVFPPYDRSALKAGIVHLGLGAFHRAHQAVYTDDAMGAAGGDWGIVGVSLRSGSVAEQLDPQDGLFSVLGEDSDSRSLRIVGAVQQVLVSPRDPAAVIEAIARQDIRIVTLTITEKGYALAGDGESLDRGDDAVAKDLAQPEHACSAIGVLALGLRARVKQGGAPLTLLSCDNLSENSRRLRGVLVDYLGSTFPDVLPWLEAHARFPCSMVDRIVPAATPEQRARQSELLGLLDEGAVSTEPFTQWIIEEDFAAGRPAWEKAGAQLVHDILPFENIKLRLLNASHSAIAYLGLLANCATVDAVMADGDLGEFVERLMAEDLMPALAVPEAFDLPAYRDQLLSRFANPMLGHRCVQIAMDGSEKIAQRWVPTLALSGAPLLRRALAAWVYFVLFTEFEIDDPRADALLQQRGSDAALSERIERVLDCARINRGSVASFDDVMRGVQAYVEKITEKGVRSILH